MVEKGCGKTLVKRNFLYLHNNVVLSHNITPGEDGTPELCGGFCSAHCRCLFLCKDCAKLWGWIW